MVSNFPYIKCWYYFFLFPPENQFYSNCCTTTSTSPGCTPLACTTWRSVPRSSLSPSPSWSSCWSLWPGWSSTTSRGSDTSTPRTGESGSWPVRPSAPSPSYPPGSSSRKTLTGKTLTTPAPYASKTVSALYLQSEERQVGHMNVNLDIDLFVISEPKWLKIGLQAHFFKMFMHAKFQLSIFFTFRVIILLVEVFRDFH